MLKRKWFIYFDNEVIIEVTSENLFDLWKKYPKAKRIVYGT